MRRNKLLVAVTLIAVVFLTGRPSAQRQGGFVTGEILVQFRPGAAAATRAQAHSNGGGNEVQQIQRTGLRLVRVPAGDELAAIARYQRNPNVLYAELNTVRTLDGQSGGPLVPSDYSFNENWGLNNTGQQFYCFGLPGGQFCFYSGMPDADIDAPEAWAVTTGDASVTVAVIDSGIDYTHPDLAPNYAGGYDFVNLDSNPMDDHGHGTHVAGTIAAALNNLTGSPAAAEGVVGVAPRARIRAYKVCRPDGSCDDFAIQQAIAQAISDGARVINMSLGETAYSQSLDAAVQDAWNAGLVIVAGAGNNGTTAPFYPAALNNVISVAAFDEDHRRPSFSNYGSWVDISAPGNAILSTYPMDQCTAGTTPGDIGCYSYLSGTSMATPHVAGAAALVWSRGDVGSNSQVVDILLNSANGSGVDAIRLDSWTIHGGLNLHGAVTYSVTRPVANAGADQTLTDNDQDGTVTVTLDGSASFDPNGSIVSYAWKEGSTTIGSAATVVTPLSLGVHTLTLQVTDNDGEIGTDTVTVTVNPTRQVTVIASTPQATEAGPTAGAFTFSRTGDTSLPLTVLYKIEGTAAASIDYQGLPGQVTIDAGASSREIAVTPINDSVAEANETVVATILADAGYYLGLPITATVTIVSDDLPADLIVSALTAPATAAPGGAISVTDTTRNQGADGGASTTRFYLSADSNVDGTDAILGSRTVPPLTAGAFDTAVTSLTVPAGTATGSYLVIAQADAANVVSESSEINNNRSSGYITIGVDLTVSALTAPATAGAGSAFSVSETTKNQGTGNSAGSTTHFYLSTNFLLDGPDVPLGSRTVPPLAAGASDTATTSLTMPAGTATGTYYVIALADGGNAVTETAETNNYRLSSSVRVGPDLIVSALTGPATAAAGGTFSVSDTTKNQGGGNGGGSTTRFYLSPNSTLDAADVILGSRTVPPLAAGASDTASTTLTLPAGTAAGTYYVIAQADDPNAVVESFESNNARASNSLTSVGPDLTVSALTAPSSAGVGATITVNDTTRNQGAGPAASSSTGYYLSANSTIGSGDVFLGSRPVDPLAPGGTMAGSAALQIPLGTAPGFYYVVARADWNTVISETSDANNDRASSTVRIGGDLIVASLTATRTAMANGPITVTDTTTNSGTTLLPGSATGFYLSLDSAYHSTDVFLGERAVGALGPAQTSSASTQVVIPAGTATGNYFVLAYADWNRVVPEINDSNNVTAFGYVRVGPDVTVTAVTGPSSAVAGTSITGGDTTKNEGGDTMPASVTSFYLSTNVTLDAADVLVGSRPVPSLAPGASDTGSATLLIPATTSGGTYYIIAVADATNAAVEPQENNNTRLRIITITAAP